MTKSSQIRFFPVASLRRDLNRADLVELEKAAFYALEKAGKGFDIHFLKFEALGRFYCLCARDNRKRGSIDIECDVISAGTTTKVITMDDHRRALLAWKSRRGSKSSAAILSSEPDLEELL